MKWKLARLSAALAALTLSATPEFDKIIVTEEHVAEVVNLMEAEYQDAGLHSLAQAESHEVPNEDDVEELLNDLDDLGFAEEKSLQILNFIAVKGRVTKDMLKAEFSLSDNNELRPLVAILQGRGLIKTGRGYYPKPKLIQLVKLAGKMGIILRVINVVIVVKRTQTLAILPRLTRLTRSKTIPPVNRRIGLLA